MSFLKAIGLHILTALVATLAVQGPAFAKPTRLPKKPAFVKHVGGGKRGPYVVIDGGSKRGFTIGSDICLYNDLGQETGCGTIERTNAKAAGIRLKVRDQAEGKLAVNPGNRAWSLAWGALPVLEGYAVQDSEDDVNQMIDDEQEEVPEEPSTLARRISLEYIYMPMLPVSSRNLHFDASARTASSGTVWTSGDEQSKSIFGLRLTVRLPKPGPWDQGLALGYQFMGQSPATTDFDVTDSSQTVESAVSAHFYYVGWNRGFALWQQESFELLASAGLNAWLVVHKFHAMHSDESSLATGSITNGLITLPLSIWSEWTSGRLEWLSGIELNIPLFMRGNRISGDVGYSEEIAASKDLTAVGEAIDVKKRMGLGLRLGVGGKF